MEDSHAVSIKSELADTDEVDITDIMIESVDEICQASDAENNFKQGDQAKVKVEPESEEVNQIHSVESSKYDINSMKKLTVSIPRIDEHDFERLMKQEYRHEAIQNLVEDQQMNIDGIDLEVSSAAVDDNSPESHSDDEPGLDNGTMSNGFNGGSREGPYAKE